MIQKIHRKRGFTLVEMLVATILLVLVSLGVGMGTSAAFNVYKESLFSSEGDILCDTLNTALSDVLRYAVYEDSKDEIVLFRNENYGVTKGHFYLKDGLLYMTRDEAEPTDGTTPLLLVNQSSYSNLQIQNFSMRYQDGVFWGSYTVFRPGEDMKKSMDFCFRSIR